MPITIGGTVVPSCNNTPTGSISSSVGGGTPAYTYQWSNGATTSDITGLIAGLYWVRVTDSLGETAEHTFYVRNSSFKIDFEVQNPSPGQSNGSLKAIVTGNLSSVSYLWSTEETTQRIDNLGAGTYMLTVYSGVDPITCAITETITILDESKGIVNMLTCCSGDLAYNYVWAVKNGLKEMAECAINKLILLQGYLEDICEYVDGGCLTEAERDSVIEKAKELCGCDCNETMFNDALKV